MFEFATFHPYACQYAADFSTTDIMIEILCFFVFSFDLNEDKESVFFTEWSRSFHGLNEAGKKGGQVSTPTTHNSDGP